jgi:CheY-like chemotaxis protein
MDIQMPVMDGYAATREIRKWELGLRNENGKNSDLKSEIRIPKSKIKGVPIIAMTAHAMAGDEDKSLESGMNGHVTKPIDPDQLFATLQKWIKPAAERAEVPKSLLASGGPPALDAPHEPDQAPPDKNELPESLLGFDLAAGLSRLMGNKRLYRKLLLDFGANYGGVAGEIREALTAKDFKQAHGLVHNLKGLAGNLEAKNLQAAAVEMEKLVKGQPEQTPSDQELKQKYADLENALKRALESVQTMCPPAAEGEKEAQLSPQAIVAKTPEISKDDAGRILTAAEKGDIEELTAAAEDLKERSDAYTPFSEKLVELAEDFDFEVIGELVSVLEPSVNS